VAARDPVDRSFFQAGLFRSTGHLGDLAHCLIPLLSLLAHPLARLNPDDGESLLQKLPRKNPGARSNIRHGRRRRQNICD
jgi:hypothetical protein